MSRIDEILEDYYEKKEKLKDLEDEVFLLKQSLESYFEDHEVNIIKSNDYTAYLKEMSVERLSKKDCPVDVWNDYSKVSRYNTLTVVKNDIKGKPIPNKRRSRSRSRDRKVFFNRKP